MANPRRRRGFTLVELLVVITIIGMLVSLLLPAVQSAREAGRRNTCVNNMRNCALALQQLESSRKYYPGYANVVNGKRASWVVPILPLLERNDLYQIWINTPGSTIASNFGIPNGNGALLADSTMPGSTPIQNPWAYSNLAIVQCPSNPATDSTGNPNSFVVNCGSQLTASDNLPGQTSTLWTDDPNSGVCFNQANGGDATAANYLATMGGGGKKVSMDFINSNDGTSNTLLISENLQASTWASDPSSDPNAQLVPWQSDFAIKQNMGFVWFIMPNPTKTLNNVLQSVTSSFNSQGATINGLFSSAPTPLDTNKTLVAYDGTNGLMHPGLTFSRPSSAHPQGVNMGFCDGHVRFVSEEIAYNVYTQLMSPKGRLVHLDASSPPTTAQKAGWNYVLNEADIQ